MKLPIANFQIPIARKLQPQRIIAHKARGVILPVVLFVLIMIGLLGAAFSFRIHADFSATQVNANRLQTRLAAEAGIERIKAILRTGRFDRDIWYNNPVDLHRVILWAHGQDSRVAGTNQEIDETMVYRFSIVADDPLDDRDYIRFGVEDESAKLNINVCTEKQLLHIVTAAIAGDAEVNGQQIVDAIIDWRDADSSARGDAGDTEGKYYEELPLNPYRVKNAPLDTVEELLLVKGVTPQILFGEDIDRNGLLTPNEDDGDRSFPPDNQDGELNRGLYPYVTTFSSEANVANDNRARGFLFGDQAALRTEVEVAFPDNPEFADFIVNASRASLTAGGQQGGGQKGGEQQGGGQQGGAPGGQQGGATGQPGGGQQGGEDQQGGEGQPGSQQGGSQQQDGGAAQPGGAQPGGSRPGGGQRPGRPGGGSRPPKISPGAGTFNDKPNETSGFNLRTAASVIVLASYQTVPDRSGGGGTSGRPGSGPQGADRGNPPVEGGQGGEGAPPAEDAGTEDGEAGDGGAPGAIPSGGEGAPGGDKGEGKGTGSRKIYSPAGLLLSTKIESRDVDSPMNIEHLPILMDRFSTLKAEQKLVQGLININTAPRLVLECIDGLTSEQIDAIIAKRDGLDMLSASTTAWLVTEGIMELEAFDKIANTLTARGTQFSVESLGYSDYQGMVTRLQAVVELNGPIVQTIYYRDLSYLGGRFPIREEDARKNKRGR